MPDRVEPCRALLTQKPPGGEGWAFEVKWDGYRLGIHRRGAELRIITRGGHDWTHRFPTIAEAGLRLPADSFILDGEAVVLDAEGRSDFSALQKALGGRGGKASAHLAILYAFDLLYLDGHDLTRMSLDERRQLLEFLLRRAITRSCSARRLRGTVRVSWSRLARWASRELSPSGESHPIGPAAMATGSRSNASSPKPS
ncbi:ATP-dependent DNA ligase [Bosea rubneri]